MTEPEFNAALATGAISVESDGGDPATAPNSTSSTPIEQFIPILMQLQSVQQCLTAAPTFIPQTFQEQIVFVFDGTDYYLYLYFNNQWNEFSVSGGGGSGVTQILAGTGISISPGGGTGNVTITATGVQTVAAGTGISVSTSGGTATVANTGITSVAAGTGISVSTSGGTATVTASGGGASFATSTGTISNVTGLACSMTTQTHDTVVTHGLGTTPKLITITVDNMQVQGDNGGSGVNLNVFLYITFDSSGTPASGMTLYYFQGTGGGSTPGPLSNGGLSTSFFNNESPIGSTCAISILSVGATTFTFRISYSQNASTGISTMNQAVTGISYLCLG